MTPPLALLPAGMLGLMAAAGPTHAADHKNVEEGLPGIVEDAYPIEYRGLEFQSVFSYERSRDKERRDLFSLEPRLVYGLFPGFQATAKISYALGDAEERKSGAAGFGGLYQFNEEGPMLPAFALSGSAEFPYGYAHGSPETGLNFIAAKTLGDPKELRDIHLNLQWTHNYDATAEERPDRYRVGVGYAQPYNATVLLVADVVHEQLLERRQSSNLVEFGTRVQITEGFVASAGVGVGLGANSPALRIVVGIQQTLGD